MCVGGVCVGRWRPWLGDNAQNTQLMVLYQGVLQSLRHTWPVASATTDNVDCIISTDQDVSNGLAVSAGTSHRGR